MGFCFTGPHILLRTADYSSPSGDHDRTEAESTSQILQSVWLSLPVRLLASRTRREPEVTMGTPQRQGIQGTSCPSLSHHLPCISYSLSSQLTAWLPLREAGQRPAGSTRGGLLSQRSSVQKGPVLSSLSVQWERTPVSYMQHRSLSSDGWDQVRTQRGGLLPLGQRPVVHLASKTFSR